jgi:hypothetical protein
MRARGPKPCSDVLEIMQNTFRDKTQEVIMVIEDEIEALRYMSKDNRSIIEAMASEILSDTMRKGLSEYEIERCRRVAVSPCRVASKDVNFLERREWKG